MKESSSPSPTVHTRNVRQQLDELADHLRRDVEIVDEPQAKALFETSAEVLKGLSTAFEHYEQKSEPAWRG